MMGAPQDEFRRILTEKANYTGDPANPYRKEDEGPQHPVTVDIPFAMARDETTYDQWIACVQDGGCGSYIPEETVFRQGPNPVKMNVTGTFPVLRISYFDALAYVEWLNKKTGSDAYRLPTEAEWEYAARAGTQTTFPQGDTLTSEQANFSKQMTEFVMLRKMPELVAREAPVKVGAMDATNAWGLRHMIGNAMELTASCYTKYLEQWTLTSEWRAAASKVCANSAMRGGSYISSIDLARSAWRGKLLDPNHRISWIGFRVIKSLE